MKVMVSVTPNLEQSQLTDLFPLSPQGEVDVQVFAWSTTNLAQLTHLLNDAELSAVVICYSRAEHFIANKLKAGIPLTAAAAEWLQLTTQIVELHKKNRQKLFLLNADLWLALPKQWPSRFIELGFCPQPGSSKTPNVDLPLLTACQFVQQNAALQQSNRLLIASSFPVTEQDMLLELPLDDVLHQNFLQQQQLQQLQDALSLAERQLQQKLVAQQQAEQAIVAAEQALLQLEQQSIEQLTAVKVELQNKQLHCQETLALLQDEKQQQAEFKKENNALLLQLQQVQEQLEQQLLLQQKQLQEPPKATEPPIAKAPETNSTAETVQQTQLVQENALLLEQLFKVQEQLEQYYLQVQQLKQAVPAKANTNSKQQLALHAALQLLRSVARDPAILSVEALDDRATVLGSELFDPSWYQQRYQLSDLPAIDIVTHYLTQGAALGYSPGPDFDGAEYLKANQDVAAAGVNPLLHFERYGKAEGRVFQALAQGAV